MSLRWDVGERAVRAYAGTRLVGRLDMQIQTRGMDEVLVVTYVKVDAADRRRGIATGLYERAAGVARMLELPLLSDTSRSAASEAFWQKQVALGRATCMKKGRGANKIDGDSLVPVRGRWPCQQFVLNTNATTLAGARKHRTR